MLESVCEYVLERTCKRAVCSVIERETMCESLRESERVIEREDREQMCVCHSACVRVRKEAQTE